MTRPSVPDKLGNLWQYHSRSDRHSKVACWSILFDLLASSELLRHHVQSEKVVFGVNREMRDFRTNRTKDLDLVIARPGGTAAGARRPLTLAEYAIKWNLSLTSNDMALLDALPPFVEGPTGSVLVALEAKACMTAHIKALPRLFDELNSSHDTVHGENEGAIAAGFAMVNASPTFISPDLNKVDLTSHHPTVSNHVQPMWASRAVSKIREIQRRNKREGYGFDAVGVLVIEARNDGSPIRWIDGEPAPGPGDSLHYDQMIRRLVHSYEMAYASI